MPEIIETTVFRLSELSDAAKDRARAWYREGGFDYDWYGAVYEDFERIAEILGIRFKTRSVRLMGGGTRQDAVSQLKLAHRLAVWFHRAFRDPAFKPKPFLLPPAPDGGSATTQVCSTPGPWWTHRS